MYDDGDEENLSKKQISSMKRNSSHIKHTIFNETLSIGDVGFKFRKLFKSNSFFLGTVSEIRLGAKNNKNRRYIYNDGDCEDLSLRYKPYRDYILCLGT